jgi:hypothetical protein
MAWFLSKHKPNNFHKKRAQNVHVNALSSGTNLCDGFDGRDGCGEGASA